MQLNIKNQKTKRKKISLCEIIILILPIPTKNLTNSKNVSYINEENKKKLHILSG
jgi:hypothetical protein